STTNPAKEVLAEIEAAGNIPAWGLPYRWNVAEDEDCPPQSKSSVKLFGIIAPLSSEKILELPAPVRSVPHPTIPSTSVFKVHEEYLGAVIVPSLPILNLDTPEESASNKVPEPTLFTESDVVVPEPLISR